ncbi:hypothetical protein ACFWBF_24200 [Streptomyces sp. NPDC060028]|uniref:hypothetical protein n=1 Tax=Streptomyces sp. NPDC060028 TaxID=3347041 RepID=UPI003698BCBD
MSQTAVSPSALPQPECAVSPSALPRPALPHAPESVTPQAGADAASAGPVAVPVPPARLPRPALPQAPESVTPQAGAGAASAGPVAVPVPPARLSRTGPAPVLRGRIGAGFSPVPHRYRLYLSAGCPLSLSVSRALVLLGLEGSVATTLLAADSGASAGASADPSADPSDGHAALRRAYEATGHHHAGPLAVPALCDTWSGRVVSNHTPDILDDLCRLSADPAFREAS